MIAKSPTIHSTKQQAISSAMRCRVVPTNLQFAKYCRAALRGLSSKTQRQIDLRPVDAWELIDWETIRDDESLPTLVVSRLADVPLEGRLDAGNSLTKHLVFIGDLPVQAHGHERCG